MHVSVRSHALEEYQKTGILEHETEYFDCDLYIKTEYGENIITNIFIVNELEDLLPRLKKMRNGMLQGDSDYYYAQVDCGDNMMLRIIYTDQRLMLIVGYEDPYEKNLGSRMTYTRQEDRLMIIEALID